MKKIINGLRYDTAKSIMVGSYDNIGRGANSTIDIHYWEATLYKTPKSGRFFLAGAGHAIAQFGTGTGWGERVIPLDAEEALQWAERYLDVEAIEEHFAEEFQDA